MGAKFVFPTSILPSILPNLQANYLIKPENYDALLADLRERTGLAISRCEVSRFHGETG